MKDLILPNMKHLASLTEGDVGKVGDDAPPRRDETGVTAPEEDERDALAKMLFRFSSSPNMEFLPNEIPFVIFKCCVIVRANDVLPGTVIRGGKEHDSDIGELLFNNIWEDDNSSGGGGGGKLLVYSCRFRCCSAHTCLTRRRSAIKLFARSSAFFNLRFRTFICSTH